MESRLVGNDMEGGLDWEGGGGGGDEGSDSRPVSKVEPPAFTDGFLT